MQHVPNQEEALSQPVDWNPFDKSVLEEFDDDTEAKDKPVFQESEVEALAWQTEGLCSSQVGRVDEGNSVAEELRAWTQHHDESDESEDAQGDVGLLDILLLLKVH